jgi:uncharacterized lipoprotein YddW (UPF0748 family)
MTSCITTKNFITNPENSKVELRGVWIASVENIDWPARKNMSYDELQKSYIDILDLYDSLNFNAVFVQIRTAGDALYPSQLAPWSRYLTGKEGLPLERDIVPWLIDQTHMRGMEFHAWLNPYRATTSLDTSLLSKQHAFYTHPDWMVKYGNRYYFNPGRPDVQSHLLEVIDEVVYHYDIDGIHFDDYFYPYKIKDVIFDDSLEYARENPRMLIRDDWRREQVNMFIQSCYNRIKHAKPHVQFGVSPFGVWRNASVDSTGSDSRAGQTVYDDLYADTRTWIKNGWLDYIAPQLYWSMEFPAASHRKLVDWWVKEAEELPLYIGLGAYKVQNNHDTVWNDIKEISRQIEYSRNTQQVDGFIVFSAKSIRNKPLLKEALLAKSFTLKTWTPDQFRWSMTLPGPTINVQRAGKIKKMQFSEILAEASEISIQYKIPGHLFKRKKWINEKLAAQEKVQFDIPSRAKEVSIILFNNSGISSRKMSVPVNQK